MRKRTVAMSIELQTFQRIRTKIQAVRYTGPRMDLDLMDSKYKHDFRFAYDYQGGKYLVTECRGLKAPHTGDWLIFDINGRHLIDVMPNDLFKATFELG